MSLQKCILITHWRTTLTAMESSPFLCNSLDGEEFICSTCDQVVKPCLRYAGKECPDKIQAGTQLSVIRERFRSAENGRLPVCGVCGRTLTAGQLRYRPLSDVCPTCRGSVIRKTSPATLKEGRHP